MCVQMYNQEIKNSLLLLKAVTAPADVIDYKVKIFFNSYFYQIKLCKNKRKTAYIISENVSRRNLTVVHIKPPSVDYFKSLTCIFIFLDFFKSLTCIFIFLDFWLVVPSFVLSLRHSSRDYSFKHIFVLYC